MWLDLIQEALCLKLTFGMVGEGFTGRLIAAAYSLQQKMIIPDINFFWMCVQVLLINLVTSRL